MYNTNKWIIIVKLSLFFNKNLYYFFPKKYQGFFLMRGIEIGVVAVLTVPSFGAATAPSSNDSVRSFSRFSCAFKIWIGPGLNRSLDLFSKLIFLFCGWKF